MLAVVPDLRSPRSLDTPDEAAAYQEHQLPEYVLARLAHDVADGTIHSEITAVEGLLGTPVIASRCQARNSWLFSPAQSRNTRGCVAARGCVSGSRASCGAGLSKPVD